MLVLSSLRHSQFLLKLIFYIQLLHFPIYLDLKHLCNAAPDSCHPITLLTEAKDRRVNVRIVTTRPSKDKNDVKKIECHALLRKKGVNIHYINTIHAKIIIIDRKVAIVSSMNLYSGSTGGGLLEAGIVSFESKVVESASKYITDLLAKTESPDITSYSSSNWRR